MGSVGRPFTDRGLAWGCRLPHQFGAGGTGRCHPVLAEYVHPYRRPARESVSDHRPGLPARYPDTVATRGSGEEKRRTCALRIEMSLPGERVRVFGRHTGYRRVIKQLTT